MARESSASLTLRTRCAATTLAAVLTATAVLGCGTSSHVVTSTSTAVREAPTVATSVTKTPTATRRRATSVALRRRPAEKNSKIPPVVTPPIVWDPIPFSSERKAQMVAYAERHYGLHTYKLINPHVIVIHFTVTPDFQSTYNTFAPDTPDPELHELPNTCAHFVIDPAGIIHQLVPLTIMCRHTVGLNWTAIGIEHVGYSDQQVLDNPRQMAASLSLVRWLRCRFHIETPNVIGHNESLTSPYHHENVTALRTQTHSDFMHADMEIYRLRLRSLGGCPA